MITISSCEGELHVIGLGAAGALGFTGGRIESVGAQFTNSQRAVRLSSSNSHRHNTCMFDPCGFKATSRVDR